MNKAELNALSSSISNHARVLYCLYLREEANPATGLSAALDYKKILALLNAKELLFNRGRQVNRLLKELSQHDLIQLSDDQDINVSMNGQSVLLPKFIDINTTFTKLYENAEALKKDWQPDNDLLTELLHMMGVIDTNLQNNEIGEFVAYRLGRPDTRLTEYQWTQKLAQQIKRSRLSSGMIPVKRVGTQIITPTSGVEADDNAKELVKKYLQQNTKP